MATRIKIHLEILHYLLHITVIFILLFLALPTTVTVKAEADQTEDVINMIKKAGLMDTSNTTEQFCTFFDNRAPKPQPNLKNCTWFKENSCCRQIEIDATFSQMKPLIGASELCQRYTNYLMCYICDPYQYTFYIWRRLSVCEEFCNEFLDSCKDATLKGSKIKDIYTSGKDFCESRRYHVKPRSSRECFYFDSAFDNYWETKNTGSFLHKNIVCLVVLSILCILNFLHFW